MASKPDTKKDTVAQTGLRRLLNNLKAFPRNVWWSMVRQGRPQSPRAQSESVFNNLFLHIHPVRVHRWTLKKSFTLGLGVATTALFAILTITGVLLMVYYKPTTAEAYHSVKDIHHVVLGGRLLRNVHRWAAHLMVVTVFLHMARVFLTCSYRKPREFNWLIGIGLLVLTLALSFTGYCLPWDQLGYWATVIGSNIAGSTRELLDVLRPSASSGSGDLLRETMLGSRQIGDDAILRFYWLHCILLPLLMVLLIALHFWRIRKDGGMSRPDTIRPEELKSIPKDEIAEESFADEEKTYTLMAVMPGKTASVGQGPKDTVRSWPHLFRAEIAVFMLVLAVVVFLGVFFDAPLKEPADPKVPENPAKAPWYFLGVQELVSYSAFSGGFIIPLVAILALASIPFLDREGRASGRWPAGREARWLGISCAFIAVLVVGLLAFLVNFGWLRNWIVTISQLWVILFNPGTILVAASLIFSLLVVKWTGSTRLGAMAVFCCFFVAYVLLTYFATIHRGPNWDFYWWPSQWPRY